MASLAHALTPRTTAGTAIASSRNVLRNIIAFPSRFYAVRRTIVPSFMIRRVGFFFFYIYTLLISKANFTIVYSRSPGSATDLAILFGNWPFAMNTYFATLLRVYSVTLRAPHAIRIFYFLFVFFRSKKTYSF